MLNFTRESTLHPFRLPLRQLFLIDFSWVLHKNFHAYKNLSVELDGVEISTGDIFGVCRLIKTLTYRYPNSVLVLCLDERPDARLELEPNYKADRKPHPEIYAKKDEILTSLFLLPHVYVAKCPGLEADDHMYSLAKKLSSYVPEVYLHTCDNDLFQAVDNNIKAFSKLDSKQQVVPLGVDYVKEKFGVTPDRLALYRSFTGDKSDNLSGYPRFPRSLIKEICKKFGNPQDFIDGSEEFKQGLTKTQVKWVDKVIESPELLRKNYQLMKLWTLDLPYIFRGSASWEPFQKYSMKATMGWFQNMLSLH